MPVSRIATLIPLPREQPQAGGALIWLTPTGTVSACGEGCPSNTKFWTGSV